MHKHTSFVAASVIAGSFALLGCGSSTSSSMMPSQADLVALSSGNRLTFIRSADAFVQGSLTVTGVNGKPHWYRCAPCQPAALRADRHQHPLHHQLADRCRYRGQYPVSALYGGHAFWHGLQPFRNSWSFISPPQDELNNRLLPASTTLT
jgi:hypothetical protein